MPLDSTIPSAWLTEDTWWRVKSFAREQWLTLLDRDYRLNVRVETRLGGVPVEGVRVEVEAEGQRISLGATGDDGVASSEEPLFVNEFTVTGSYENDEAGLQREDFVVEVSEVSIEDATAHATNTHKIDGLDGSGPGGSFEVQFEGPTPVWRERDEDSLLTVTVKLCTLSLMVPYLNQRATNDTITSRPDKEPDSIDRAIKGPVSGKWSGSVLCYPSSVKMLLAYWGVDKKRAEVMQKCYDIWASDSPSFTGRIDKLPNTSISNSPPANPNPGAYWLDNSATGAPDWPLKRASYALAWQTIASANDNCDYVRQSEPIFAAPGETWKKHKNATQHFVAWYDLDWKPAATTESPMHEGAESPNYVAENTHWRDTSGARSVVKIGTRKMVTWKIEKDPWRVRRGGMPIWQFPQTQCGVLDAWKPAGSKATREPKLSNEVLPLSKLLAGDPPLNTSVLEKYKTWLTRGWPFIISTTATHGHVMIVRGAVLNAIDEIEWLITNDPYGTLEGHEDPSYQSSERNDASGSSDDGKGKHVYYRNSTHGRGNTLRIKGDNRGFSRIEKSLSEGELRQKIVPGSG